jgi:hypothetical protein
VLPSFIPTLAASLRLEHPTREATLPTARTVRDGHMLGQRRRA